MESTLPALTPVEDVSKHTFAGRVSPRKLRTLHADGEIPGVVVGRRLFFTAEQVDEIIELFSTSKKATALGLTKTSQKRVS